MAVEEVLLRTDSPALLQPELSTPATAAALEAVADGVRQCAAAMALAAPRLELLSAVWGPASPWPRRKHPPIPDRLRFLSACWLIAFPLASISQALSPQ